MPVALKLEKAHRQGRTLDEKLVRSLIAEAPLLRSNHMNAMYLPNLVRKILKTCFSLSQRPGNRANDPVGHILNKAWPMRCSVRNFSDIVATYIVEHPHICTLMRKLLYSTMVGAYPQATTRATVGTRLVLYKYFQSKPLTAEQFAAWLQQGHYLLLFVAIKEYISFTVSQLPGLHNVLLQCFNWSTFTDSVTRLADTVRVTLNQYTATPACMFDNALHMIRSARSHKCPAPPPDINHISDQIQTATRLLFNVTTNMYTKPLRVSIYHIINGAVLAGVPLEKLCTVFHVDPRLADLIGTCVKPNATLANFRRLRAATCGSEAEAVLIHELVQAWICCKQIRCFELPPHMQEQQKAVTERRQRHVYVCMCCRQLRAFVVDEGSTTNAWACGNHRVLLDDETSVVYCGKRSESHSASTDSSGNDTMRAYWKRQQSMMCSHAPLLSIDLEGKVLSFFGKLFMLCPLCGCIMRVRDSRFCGHTIMCVSCSYRTQAVPDTRCFHCYTECPTMEKVALQTTTVYVCKACTRRWMKDNSITQNITEDVAHQAINERWSLNRVAVYCVCA